MTRREALADAVDAALCGGREGRTMMVNESREYAARTFREAAARVGPCPQGYRFLRHAADLLDVSEETERTWCQFLRNGDWQSLAQGHPTSVATLSILSDR